MDNITYYKVPPDKIGLVLLHLNSYGWEFKQAGIGGISIEKHYIQATSRDWDGHICIFKIEEWKNYKYISITSDLLMKVNNQSNKVYSYDELKKRIGLL